MHYVAQCLTWHFAKEQWSGYIWYLLTVYQNNLLQQLVKAHLQDHKIILRYTRVSFFFLSTVLPVPFFIIFFSFLILKCGAVFFFLAIWKCICIISKSLFPFSFSLGKIEVKILTRKNAEEAGDQWLTEEDTKSFRELLINLLVIW